MEKSKGYHHGYAIEDAMPISPVCITDMDHLVILRIDGERVGLLHGYRRNRGDLISSECIEVVAHLVLAGLLDLEVRVAAFLGVAI
jgi:hypothetical protein